ncbi:MAG: hypothetical protein PHQ40_10120 [Anaerolineaceae bacterium]|nr:hypothetical protein [Anaerolineaceae bacterium]
MSLPSLPQPFGGLLWLLLALGLLLWSQRQLHSELQSILLLITRQPTVALVIFSLLFFPGVFLHEASHFLAARLLGARTGRFSLIPQMMPGGRLRLGYVEAAPAGAFRDALIGVAPLLSGAGLVAWVGLNRLGLGGLEVKLTGGGIQALLAAVAGIPQQTDFWIWFYLVFTLSSTMFPSTSDRRGWLSVSLVITGLLIGAILAGAGPWMAQALVPGLERAMQSVAAIFSVCLAVQVVLLPPLWLLRVAISKMWA